MELTQLATTDQKKSLEVRQMSEAGPSPQRTQTADSTMSMVVEKKRVSIQLDSMPRPRPANITTVNKGSGSLSNLSSAEEDLLEGGQSISPAGQTISSRPASPIRSRQSDDVQARQPAAANFGVNNEEMYDMRVESADLDFVVPRSFFCTLDQFNLRYTVRNGHLHSLHVAQLQNASGLSRRHKMAPDDAQMVLVKFIYPVQHSDAVDNRNGPTEAEIQASRDRFESELHILAHFALHQRRLGARVMKLMGCTNNDVDWQIHALVSAVYPLPFIQFMNLLVKEDNDNPCMITSQQCNYAMAQKFVCLFIFATLQQIASTIDEIHKLGYSHNGISPSSFRVEMQPAEIKNMFQYRVLLCNFDMVEYYSRQRKHRMATKDRYASSQVNDLALGSVFYLAPEHIRYQHMNGAVKLMHDLAMQDKQSQLRRQFFAADVFSWASVAYWMLEQCINPYSNRRSDYPGNKLHDVHAVTKSILRGEWRTVLKSRAVDMDEDEDNQRPKFKYLRVLHDQEIADRVKDWVMQSWHKLPLSRPLPEQIAQEFGAICLMLQAPRPKRQNTAADNVNRHMKSRLERLKK